MVEPDAVASRGPVSEQVFARIMSELVTLTIEPGERITVDALARRFGLSQTPVREALGRLEADGLVVKTHLRGYRAAPALTKREFIEMFDVRLLLEPFAARQAARLGTTEQFAELQAANDRAAKILTAAEEQPRHSEFATLDERIHDMLARASGNRLVQGQLARLHPQLHIFRLRLGHTVVQEAIDEHQRIIDAVVRRDEHVAEGAMRSHVENSYRRILENLDGSD